MGWQPSPQKPTGGADGAMRQRTSWEEASDFGRMPGVIRHTLEADRSPREDEPSS